MSGGGLRFSAIAIVVVFCSLLDCAVGQAPRTLVTGQPCAIPFEFNGELHNDCIQFSGLEWCPAEGGFFGMCEAPGPTAVDREVQSTTISDPAGDLVGPDGLDGDLDGKPVQSVPASGSVDCCSLLASIGFSSELPVIVLDSQGNDIPDEPKINGLMCTCGAPGGDVNGPMGIEIRGSTSARDFSKKSFSMELRGQLGEDASINLFGLGEDSDWILYGPEMDKSVGLRNYLTMNLFQGTGRYASDVIYCEVFLIEDGSTLDMAHYNGLYVLMEKVKRDKNRVDVQKNKDDLSGGYIFKYDNDNFDDGDVILTSEASGLKFVMTYPKKEADDSHKGWLSEYISNFELALATGLRENWAPFIDEASFIDIFLITELTKNPDGYRGSFYFHKDAGLPLAGGPPWDYNEAYGMCCGYPIDGFEDDGISTGVSGGSAISPEGWRFNICLDPERCQIDPIDGVSRWFRVLMRDPTFRSAVGSRWATLRSGPWSDAQIVAIIDRVIPQIQSAVGRNHDRWSEVHGDASNAQYIATWTDEVEKMRSFTLAHAAWMDASLSPEGIDEIVLSADG
ncbi:hypothetical protein BSKO_05629 [Bryopsis sp. KO-2023]|nr:hypothetical protein BSKO_05629 [Bryopsis sp. KO-2023]